jgi:hypothetical protein
MKLKKHHIASAIGVIGIVYYVFFCPKAGASASEDSSGGGGFFGGLMPSFGTSSASVSSGGTSPVLASMQASAKTPISVSAIQKAENLIKSQSPIPMSTSSGTQSGGGLQVGQLPVGSVNTGTEISTAPTSTLPTAPTSTLPTGGTVLIPKTTSPIGKSSYDSSGINPSSTIPFSGKGKSLTLDNLFH